MDKKKCVCGGELEYEDNSFSHEFGRKEEEFYYCLKCNKQYEVDDIL